MSAPRPAYFKGVRRALSLAEPLPRTVERRLRGVFQVEVQHAYLCAQLLGRGFDFTEAARVLQRNRDGAAKLVQHRHVGRGEMGLAAAPDRLDNSQASLPPHQRYRQQ